MGVAHVACNGVCVCVSTNFDDPMTSAHTQRIESMWAAAKLWRRTHGYKSKDALQEYLHVFLSN